MGNWRLPVGRFLLGAASAQHAFSRSGDCAGSHGVWRPAVLGATKFWGQWQPHVADRALLWKAAYGSHFFTGLGHCFSCGVVAVLPPASVCCTAISLPCRTAEATSA